MLTAMKTQWSNGPAEAHVHRLKLIKRSRYGLTRFDLLRIRALGSPVHLPAPCGGSLSYLHQICARTILILALTCASCSKGGRRDCLAVDPSAVHRIRAYLDAAGHADDLDGPMFCPLSHNRRGQEGRRHMGPGAIDRVLRIYTKAIGLASRYSAQLMRATFITTPAKKARCSTTCNAPPTIASLAPLSSMTTGAIVRRSLRFLSYILTIDSQHRMMNGEFPEDRKMLIGIHVVKFRSPRAR